MDSIRNDTTRRINPSIEKAREFLMKSFTLRKQIAFLEERAEFYSMKAGSVQSIDYEKDKVQTSPSNEAPFVKWIHLEMETNEKIKELMDELGAVELKMVECISSVEDPFAQQVLSQRYFDDCSWQDIADKSNKSLSLVYKAHKTGLRGVYDKLKALGEFAS